METYSEMNVTGSIDPVQAGTRLRENFDTYSASRGSYSPGDVVAIDLIKTCLVSTDRSAVQVGDTWARVLSINGVAVPQPSWMAIKYHDWPICLEHWVEAGTPVARVYTMEEPILSSMGDLLKITGPADGVWNIMYNGQIVAISGGGTGPQGLIQNVEVDRTDGETTVIVDGETFTKPEP